MAARTSFYTATTLDGFIADEHDSLAWLFKQEQRDRDAPLAYDTFIADIGAIAMGWTTYAWVVDHLAEEENDVLPPFQQQVSAEQRDALGMRWLEFHERHEGAEGLSGDTVDPEAYVEEHAGP